VGACEGLFTLKASAKAKKVFAIEPNVYYAKALQKSFANTDNVEILNCAVGDKRNVVKFSNSGISSKVMAEDQEGDFTIEQIPLDELFKEQRISYIKADIEGYEPVMLQGARN